MSLKLHCQLPSISISQDCRKTWHSFLYNRHTAETQERHPAKFHILEVRCELHSSLHEEILPRCIKRRLDSTIEKDTESMMPKRSLVRSDSAAKYHRLANIGGDGFVDLQFEKPPPRIPYKAILLAALLFVIGTTLIVIGALLLTGIINAKYSDRTWPVLILGALMFIPGAYHVRIAYYAYKGYQGYSYEDIPEFD